MKISNLPSEKIIEKNIIKESDEDSRARDERHRRDKERRIAQYSNMKLPSYFKFQNSWSGGGYSWIYVRLDKVTIKEGMYFDFDSVLFDYIAIEPKCNRYEKMFQCKRSHLFSRPSTKEEFEKARKEVFENFKTLTGVKEISIDASKFSARQQRNIISSKELLEDVESNLGKCFFIENEYNEDDSSIETEEEYFEEYSKIERYFMIIGINQTEKYGFTYKGDFDFKILCIFPNGEYGFKNCKDIIIKESWIRNYDKKKKFKKSEFLGLLNAEK